MLCATRSLEAQIGPPQLEEASEVARRAALAAMRGPQQIFSEALDLDGILARRIGSEAWRGLTDRQRERLRSVVRDRFLQTLAPPPSVKGEIAWSAARPAGANVDVFLGLRLGDAALKTRWALRRVGPDWRVADVILSDPGISVAESALNQLGPEPVHRRQRGSQARSEVAWRLAGLAAIAMVVLLAAPRLSREKRILLFTTAAAPTLLFLVDGVLAVRQTLSEPYVLEETLPREPWRQAEQQALLAEREGRSAEARRQWAGALAAGEEPAPVEYQIGLAERQRSDLPRATASFERALAEARPAPGAAKELAAIASAQGRFAVAEKELARYFSLAGPDPDTLSLDAVVKTNLGRTAEAVASIRGARQLVGDGWRGAELEAQIHARAGDAAGAVAALRPLEPQGLLDRSALRADPAYLPIATDPIWVGFLGDRGRNAAPPGRPPAPVASAPPAR